jgi:hypothetical protein
VSVGFQPAARRPRRQPSLLKRKVTIHTTELFEGGFEVFDDFLGEDVGTRALVGFFEAFISEPEDVDSIDSGVVAFEKPADSHFLVRVLCHFIG